MTTFGSVCSPGEPIDFQSELVSICQLLAAYAHDFDVSVGDMFAEVIAFDDPEDDEVNAEVHFCIGYVLCAARVLELAPVQVVAEYQEK